VETKTPIKFGISVKNTFLANQIKTGRGNHTLFLKFKK
jgi:hypothetical protein